MNVEHKQEELHGASKLVKDIDLIGNRTDKRRSNIIQRLRNVLADIRKARRKRKEDA